MNFGLTRIGKDQLREGTPIIEEQSGREIVLREGRQVAIRRGRPPFNPSKLYCCVCDKTPSSVAHYYAETGYSEHDKMSPEQAARMGAAVFDCGEGYIHCYVECHGMKGEFIATFDQMWAAIDTNQKIRIFEPLEDNLENKAGSPGIGEPEMKMLKARQVN